MKEFIIVNQLSDLDDHSKELVLKAKEALAHAYAPYSNFMVGAAALLDDGSIITGMNQENAAYPSGLCAERVALFSAYSLYPNVTILKVAVTAQRRGESELTPATCCGECRQVLLEFENRQKTPIEIIMQSQQHQWIKAPSALSLLPFGFTSASL
ncbi:cytidine deaminase [Ohtaekwangia koreensis]|jgi:cytidine deaminase|uniref:Cytidine deaminase n=1 Tax=Ohtaekwangia koreensis TaxID=688867 RepID=A0A1T5J0R4_9BACT|nr:cytidine deaminase [Ohtaekwangia koreensis]SKC45065.1 cytidine deaminase [Ohtaekwangia koreensis]